MCNVQRNNGNSAGNGQPDYDVVIIGGGTTGLAAAIEAAQNGASRVLVLERRGSAARQFRTVLIEDAVMADFERHGLITSDDRVFRRIDHFTAAIEANRTRATFNIQPRWDPKSSGVGKSRRAFRTRHVFFRRSPRHTALLAEIESGYIAAAQEWGVEVRFNTPLVVIGGLSSGHPWVECPITTDSLESPGQMERIRARVLGIADGSRSEAMRQLSVSRVSVGSRNQKLLVARFAWSANDVPRRPGLTFFQATESAGGQLFLACLDEVETSVILNVPPDRLLESPDERKAFANAGARVLGIHGRLDPTSIFVCEHTAGISRRMTIGDSVFVMGDAACSASPYTGLGLNAGIRDAIRFGSAVRRHLKASNKLQLTWARTRYAIQTWCSVAVLLAFSAIMLKVTRLPTSEARAKAANASAVRAWVASASSAFFLVFLRGLIRLRLTDSHSGPEAVQKAS